jgi:hypothetical protein
MISKITIPKSNVPGMNTKILGRVAPVKNVKPVKIASAPVEFAHADEETEKTAAAFNFLSKVPEPARQAFWSGVGASAVGAVAYGVGAGIDAAKGLLAQTKYDKALKDAIAMSPALQMHGYETLKKYMPLVIKSSPTVAGEPLLLANYLETMIDAQGHMNASIFSSLTDLEGSMLRNNQAKRVFSDSLVNTAVKGVAESTGKSFGKVMADIYAREAKQQKMQGGQV